MSTKTIIILWAVSIGYTIVSTVIAWDADIRSGRTRWLFRWWLVLFWPLAILWAILVLEPYEWIQDKFRARQDKGGEA